MSGNPEFSQPSATPSGPDRFDTTRESARRRLERKHKLLNDVVAYVVINAFLIGVWAFTGFGYFWPGWVLAIWGVFLVLDAWELVYRREVTEEDIQREMHRFS